MMEVLDGLRVLDVTQYIAGPYCSAILADLGAEVIHVEPLSGDTERVLPPFIKNESHIFTMINRNKKGVTLNLKTEKGKEILKQLVAKSDVLVNNSAPGVMESLGLDYKGLIKVNPAVIYASVSGFGQTGPYRLRPAYGFMIEAMAGLMSMTGYAETPVRCGATIGDYIAALNTAVAILVALQHRAKTGEGQEIDISIQDCLWACAGYEGFPWYFVEGKVPPRADNRHPMVAHWGVYPTRDGMVVIGVITDPHWQALLKAMGREDLKEEVRFETSLKRVENVDEVEAIVEEWAKTKTVDEIVTKLVEAQLPCAPLLDIAEVANDPQILARNMIVEVDHPIAGRIKTCGSPLKLSETPGRIKHSAPFLGQHNEEVYSDLLGLSKEEIAKLKEEGVV